MSKLLGRLFSIKYWSKYDFHLMEEKDIRIKQQICFLSNPTKTFLRNEMISDEIHRRFFFFGKTTENYSMFRLYEKGKTAS